MVINWYGEGCFKIQTSTTAILVDPFESSTGLTPPRFKADITLVTNASFTKMPFPNSEITGPGEYEINGIEINGFLLAPDKTIYIVNAEDMRLAFLGHIADETPDADLMEKLNGADLLFIPAGGKPFIDQERAAKLIKQISPKMVVASFLKTPGLKRKAENAQEFLKELEKKTEAQEKLTIKKKDLTEKMEAVVLRV